MTQPMGNDLERLNPLLDDPAAEGDVAERAALSRQNELYNVNAIPFHYTKHPIAVKVGALVRIFLVNILEYDPINSFHLHANFFHYYPTGTSRTPAEYTDTIAQMQGQRGLLEFRYRYAGRYLFHAHKTEFAELGWSGLFPVVEA